MPKWFYEYASHGIGEVAYALDLAIRNNINCVTGEPSQLQIIDGLEQQEFTKEDFLSWHICSMLKHRYKYKTLDTDNIEGAIQEFRKNLLRQIPIAESNCNKLNFYNWYHEKLHTSFHIEHLASLDGSPSKNNTSNYLQKIMQAIDNVREPNIVNTIHQQLQSNDKVLVIYGAAHEFKHKIVLQNLMSQHTITSLNP